MNSTKLFPIQNQSACVWKWGWNTFRLFTGTTSSCHRVANEFVPLDSFDDFHHTKEIVNDRKLMLQNQWPVNRGCEYCKHVEEAGGISDRTFHNSLEGLTPLDFYDTEDHSRVTPRVLELYLNNTCDLSCVYCIPVFSSKINEELKKFGPIPDTANIVSIKKIPDHHLYLEKMISWLDKHSSKLGRLSIQGGEPFLQKELETLMLWLESNSNPNLEISFNTNLNEKPGVIEDYINRLKKLLIKKQIQRVDLHCSIDCWGPRQEFIRYGLDLERWRDNFEILLQHKWLFIHTSHTITSLSMKTFPDLLAMINDYRSQGHRIFQTFQYVDGQTQVLYDPVIFGGDFFVNDLARAKALMINTMEQQRFVGVAKRILSSNKDPVRLAKLKNSLNEIDRRRNTDWKNLFPEINEFFLENGI
jgi:hypothetical protein